MDTPILYKQDSTGSLRSWQAEIQDDQWRTVSGLVGGSLVYSDWRTEQGKQGRNNLEQVEKVVAKRYKDRLENDYYLNEEEASKGAKFYKPMLAASWKAKSFKPGMVQPKLDGIRCIVNRDGMFSRSGKEIVSCPHIHEALKPLFEDNPGYVFDGELYNHDLRDDFDKISGLVRKTSITPKVLAETRRVIQYHVYDFPGRSGADFVGRNSVLEEVLRRVSGQYIKYVETLKMTTVEEFDSQHEEWVANQGYEGSIWRDFDGLYENKRSKYLQKRKDFEDAEFEIVEIKEGTGNWAGHAKSVEIRLPNGKTCEVGMRGSKDFAKNLLLEKDTYKVVTVRYFATNESGALRMGVALRFYQEDHREF